MKAVSKVSNLGDKEPQEMLDEWRRKSALGAADSNDGTQNDGANETEGE